MAAVAEISRSAIEPFVISAAPIVPARFSFDFAIAAVALTIASVSQAVASLYAIWLLSCALFVIVIFVEVWAAIFALVIELSETPPVPTMGKTLLGSVRSLLVNACGWLRYANESPSPGNVI